VTFHGFFSLSLICEAHGLARLTNLFKQVISTRSAKVTNKEQLS
jgi:hypothetical protein